MATLRINPNGVRKLKQAGLYGTNSQLARHMDVSPATVSRVMDGTAEPGIRVVAGAIKAFGQAAFFELFDVVEDSK